MALHRTEMCPTGYEMDVLSWDCIPVDTVPVHEEASTISLTTTVVSSESIARVTEDYTWITYIAGISIAFTAVVTIIVFVSVHIQRRKTAARRANIYVEAPEEFDKLNGSTSRKKSFCLQENNSNSQVVNKISKDLVVKTEVRNTGYSEVHNGNAKNCTPENNLGPEQTEDHSFPLPATELGATVLVTTKTIQVAGETSQC
ncbi:uncharacterized protein LOC127585656 [Pristis pectinata]|uniref:uncharacterized protein LOC127585656 n=1 Tax=Pristis pectinata TaxID=685728 RepID=UPI00223CB78E|nr:uncharacterized protein LOC127585656 [Pristis pectinata]